MNIQEFDFEVPVDDALLWQYDNAVRLQSLINSKREWYFNFYETFWSQWYFNVFNLLTANEFGLSVWSIILNLPLFIELNPDESGKPLFGFNELTVFPTYINSYLNFNNSNFSTRSSTIKLTIEQQRLVLRLRYFQLTSRVSIPEVNAFLNVLFEDVYTKTNPNYGMAWILDGLDMTMTYVFNFNIPRNLLFIFEYYDILPRPAGVKLKSIINNGLIFGFNEVTTFPDYVNTNLNFENGNFLQET